MTTVVGVVIPLRDGQEDAFAQAVAHQLSLHGGTKGIQDTYANGGPLKLVIIKQGTDTSMCDVVLH